MNGSIDLLLNVLTSNVTLDSDLTASVILARIEKINPPIGSVSEKGDYAYLFEAHHYYTPKLLNELHKKNIRVKVGLTPFTIEGKPYDYGTYMIPSKNQEVNDERSELRSERASE